MTLRVGPEGARLTVPPGAPEREVRAMLRRHAAWLAENLAAAAAAAPPPLADGSVLALLDARVVLRLRPGAGGPARLQAGELILAAGPAGASGALERWYRAEARRRLAAMAAEEAAALGVGVAAVSVRDPRSRWGSCSASGRLSFSWRLLAAPAFVARHVVVHEACHIVRPDHSPAFWALVRARDPRADEARAWLRAHGGLLRAGPGWPALAGAPGGPAAPAPRPAR